MTRPLVPICALLLGCTALHLAPDTDHVAALRIDAHSGFSAARRSIQSMLTADGYTINDTTDYVGVVDPARDSRWPPGVTSTHANDGNIYINLETAVFFTEWAAGGQSDRHLSAVHVVVHEIMHGIGPATDESYTGVGIKVEEVASELVAHYEMATWGIYSPVFAYGEYYRDLSYDRAFVVYSRETMTAAARQYKQLPAGSVMSADDAVSTFEWLIEGLE